MTAIIVPIKKTDPDEDFTIERTSVWDSTKLIRQARHIVMHIEDPPGEKLEAAMGYLSEAERLILTRAQELK